MEMINRHTHKKKLQENGFTLIELMMALAIMSLVMSAMITTFRSQSRSWVTQQEIANMQQNLRAGMYNLERSIRMAGYDPRHSQGFGFVSSFPAPYESIDATTDGDQIAFTIDNDEDQVVDGNVNEMVTWRRNPTTNALEYPNLDGTWTEVAHNISAIAFTYLDENNAVTTNLADIRTVQITMTAQSSRASVTSTRSITSRIRCRNL